MPLITLLALAVAAPQAGDAVVGRWKTEVHNAIVEINRCGPSICGRILTSDALRANPGFKDAKNSDVALRNRPLLNLQILGGFTADGAAWSGGKIYNADDGKTYGADVSLLSPNQLKVRGCIFKPLCKTQTWTRVR
jgi:uncharacterized protein (DUF2147 family)